MAACKASISASGFSPFPRPFFDMFFFFQQFFCRCDGEINNSDLSGFHTLWTFFPSSAPSSGPWRKCSQDKVERKFKLVIHHTAASHTAQHIVSMLVHCCRSPEHFSSLSPCLTSAASSIGLCQYRAWSYQEGARTNLIYQQSLRKRNDQKYNS